VREVLGVKRGMIFGTPVEPPESWNTSSLPGELHCESRRLAASRLMD